MRCCALRCCRLFRMMRCAMYTNWEDVDMYQVPFYLNQASTPSPSPQRHFITHHHPPHRLQQHLRASSHPRMPSTLPRRSCSRQPCSGQARSPCSGTGAARRSGWLGRWWAGGEPQCPCATTHGNDAGGYSSGYVTSGVQCRCCCCFSKREYSVGAAALRADEWLGG